MGEVNERQEGSVGRLRRAMTFAVLMEFQIWICGVRVKFFGGIFNEVVAKNSGGEHFSGYFKGKYLKESVLLEKDTTYNNYLILLILVYIAQLHHQLNASLDLHSPILQLRQGTVHRPSTVQDYISSKPLCIFLS